jgi:hypothetical protein
MPTLSSVLDEIEVGHNIFIDSETCGLHGMMVLLQWAVDDGPIHLLDVWKEPIWKTLRLIEAMLPRTLVFFNTSFDWFHICKLYTIFRLCPGDWIPEQHIDEIAALEDQGKDGPCLKPAHTLDLMLHARKGPYQSLMARGDIRIRRVPTALANALADELEGRIAIDDIYFARSANQDAPRWQVFDILRKGKVDPDFKDVMLQFNPAGGLKFLAEHALKLKPKFHFKDVEVSARFHPKELGYAPTAMAVSRPQRKWEVYKTENCGRKLIGHAWPGVIQHHIDHWAGNTNAREYATDDIVYTRGLWEHFDRPEPDDDDSVLACMVAAVRWHGFEIDRPGIAKMLRVAQATVNRSPININKPSEVRQYICACMDETESLVLEQSTKKRNIEEIAKWEVGSDEEGWECSKCNGGGCLRCEQGVFKAMPVVEDCEKCEAQGCEKCQQGKIYSRRHPAAIRANELLQIKLAIKEVELYKKLLKARRFHTSFKVIGTLSTRMSGADGLNPQGIKHANVVRRLFPLAWQGYDLCGGDFDSFEVVLADAVWGDSNLRSDLMNGKKIHALFGMDLFPGQTYEEIVASSGTSNDMYVKGKQGVFGTIYGGDHNTLVKNLGIPLDVALAAFNRLSKRYPEMARSRQKTFNAFCSMKQPVTGGAVYWGQPADYIESFLGFRRYFTLENMVCKALFELAQRPPKSWRQCRIKVRRRDKEQFATGATASALYGAAFQIQAANMRAAANHEIQSPGAQITKNVQRRVWDLQPPGIHPFVVAPMNIHDELLTVTKPEYVERVTEKVIEGVEAYRNRVPLIGMTWNESMDSWAEKKGGSRTVKISWKREAINSKSIRKGDEWATSNARNMVPNGTFKGG